VKLSSSDVVVAVLLLLVVLFPSPSSQPAVDPPVDPPPVVVPVIPVDPSDILDRANDQVRVALADLLLIYVGEDLTDSKYFDQFSAELSRVQAEAFLPVAKAICDSADLSDTSEDVSNHSLGSK
jgi:hypothetical protein